MRQTFWNAFLQIVKSKSIIVLVAIFLVTIVFEAGTARHDWEYLAFNSGIRDLSSLAILKSILDTVSRLFVTIYSIGGIAFSILFITNHATTSLKVSTIAT